MNNSKAMNMQNINRWNTIDWAQTQNIVFKWQQEIYSASKNDDIRLVRKLQKQLVTSIPAKLLAIRRVTQDNQGKTTPGIDGIKSLDPQKRLDLIKELNIPTKAQPLRRVWIPKPGTQEKRPLGIPTIKDRCLQALMKLAIEPEWEARFETNSYGFRPGRRCHDAIKAIQDSLIKGPKYVLDADIAKCFDRINHEALIKKIGIKGALAKQIKSWLKAGVLNGDTFEDTSMGTPQGGVISPLLANIALHGLENHLKNWIATQPIKNRKGALVRPSRRAETLHVIRYADDFVVLHSDKQVIITCKELIKEFLAEIGLELSMAKTRLTHTLEINPLKDTVEEGFDQKIGFNFLGFTFKQYKTKHRSAKATTGEKLGIKTLIFPSQKSKKKNQNITHDIILKQGKALTQSALIKKLNPIIRGWASYFGISDANTTSHLTKHDYLIYLKLRKWAKRKTGTSGKGSKYWRKVGNNKWTFSKTDDEILLKHADYSKPLNSYVKIIGNRSPYDQNQLHWAQRMATNPTINKRVSTLLKRQKGLCNWCKIQFQEEDILEVDHIIPISQKGKDTYNNLQLLHRHCHDNKTSSDKIKYAPNIQEGDSRGAG